MAVMWLEYVLGMSIDEILESLGLSRDPNPFTDTSDPYILGAYALGITSGTSATTFNPSGQFTREQAATMIMNTCRVSWADVNNSPVADFTDMHLASAWARTGINFVRANGIMSGVSADPPRFDPKALYTREQSIVTFNNISYSNDNSYDDWEDDGNWDGWYDWADDWEDDGHLDDWGDFDEEHY
jgi:hypothetical protein